MTESEFLFQMNRLITVYGDRAYPQERVTQILLKNKWRHPKVFEDAIDCLIGDNAHPPMLSKIQEACAASQRRFPELDTDPFKPIREKIYEETRVSSPCSRCGNYGVFDVYRKYSGLVSVGMLCRCSSAELARKLPENRSHRILDSHDAFYLIYDFDPNRNEKFQIYGNLFFETVEAAIPRLNELYYKHDVNMEPCYWRSAKAAE